MRVLIIRSFPDKLNTDSYNVQEIGLAHALRSKGVECDIAFYNGRDESYSETLADGTVVYHRKGINLLKNGFLSGLKELVAPYDVLQVHEYDQLQSFQIYSRLARKWGKPVVLYHGPYMSAYTQGYNLKCSVFDRLFLPFAGTAKQDVLCMTKSRMAADFLRSKGFARVRTVGVGLMKNSDEPAGPELVVTGTSGRMETISGDSIADRMPEDALNLLYVGKLEDRRNSTFLVSLLEELAGQPIFATVIGKFDPVYPEGPALRKRMAALEEKGLLQYVESASQQELIPVYDRADVFLFPTRYDIFGMVLLEAMDHGCVVLSTENGGSSTLIQNGENGRILPEDAIGLWTEAIRELMENPDLRKEMGRCARQTVEDSYLWERRVDAFIACYREAVEN